MLNKVVGNTLWIEVGCLSWWVTGMRYHCASHGNVCSWKHLDSALTLLPAVVEHWVDFVSQKLLKVQLPMPRKTWHFAWRIWTTSTTELNAVSPLLMHWLEKVQEVVSIALAIVSSHLSHLHTMRWRSLEPRETQWDVHRLRWLENAKLAPVCVKLLTLALLDSSVYFLMKLQVGFAQTD